MILAGDVGGTKVHLALFSDADDEPRLEREGRFLCGDYSNLESLLDDFIGNSKSSISKACLGVAGPIIEGRCKVTHLPWVVELSKLKSLLGIDSVWMINDMAATACAIPFLEPSEVKVLSEGQPNPTGPIASLSAGTGLGQAGLSPDGKGRYFIIESEGGHSSFSARNSLETALLDFLTAEYGAVCQEHIISGPGLVNAYRFAKKHFSIDEPDWLTKEFKEDDPPKVVSRNGLNGKSPACEKALEIFISALGASAGNLALQFAASGGVYAGGGIVPHLVTEIGKGPFMDAFWDKEDKFREFMKRVPVKVILDDKVVLKGAAHYALGKKFHQRT